MGGENLGAYASGSYNPTLAFGGQPTTMPAIPTLPATPVVPTVRAPAGSVAVPNSVASLPSSLESLLKGVLQPLEPVSTPSPYSPIVQQQGQAYAAQLANGGGYNSTILSGNYNSTGATADVNTGRAAPSLSPSASTYKPPAPTPATPAPAAAAPAPPTPAPAPAAPAPAPSPYVASPGARSIPLAAGVINPGLLPPYTQRTLGAG